MSFGGGGNYGDYGGGFMADSSQQQGGDAGAKKSKFGGGLLPATIKQVHDARDDSGEDSGFKIDGRECTQVTIVAQIIHVAEQAVCSTYTLEDSTGRIDASMWQDQDESDYMLELRRTWTQGAYVRVVGSPKPNSNGGKLLNTFHMRIISDFNEITYHFLDAIHTHLYNTRGPQGSAGGPPAGASSFASPGKPNSGPGAGYAAGGGGGGAKGGAAVAYSAPSGGGAMDLGAWVTKAFAELPSSPETGLSVADISRYCSNMTGRDIAKSAISSICDNMSIQGHIYSTIDEEHFAKI